MSVSKHVLRDKYPFGYMYVRTFFDCPFLFNVGRTAYVSCWQTLYCYYYYLPVAPGCAAILYFAWKESIGYQTSNGQPQVN